MLEQTIDLWEPYDQGAVICITTNGTVKNNGECVMGRGCAAQAKKLFPKLPKRLGDRLREEGNHTHFFEDIRIISFPVKHNWYEKADLKLIERSAQELASWDRDLGTIYIPRPGCGNGQLKWEDVKPYLEFLPDKYVLVTI